MSSKKGEFNNKLKHPDIYEKLKEAIINKQSCDVKEIKAYLSEHYGYDYEISTYYRRLDTLVKTEKVSSKKDLLELLREDEKHQSVDDGALNFSIDVSLTLVQTKEYMAKKVADGIKKNCNVDVSFLTLEDNKILFISKDSNSKDKLINYLQKRKIPLAQSSPDGINEAGV